MIRPIINKFREGRAWEPGFLRKKVLKKRTGSRCDEVVCPVLKGTEDALECIIRPYRLPAISGRAEDGGDIAIA
jgi:hypothetical protein